jgi:hypothetical protein
VTDWYSYVAKKVAPKPAYQRPPPSKVITQENAPVRNEPEGRAESMIVEEGTASDSMILKAFRFWQR